MLTLLIIFGFLVAHSFIAFTAYQLLLGGEIWSEADMRKLRLACYFWEITLIILMAVATVWIITDIFYTIALVFSKDRYRAHIPKGEGK